MIRARHFMSQQTIVRYLLHLGKLVIIMPAKKVIFVIVEGPTNEDALGAIFQRFFDKNMVREKSRARRKSPDNKCGIRRTMI